MTVTQRGQLSDEKRDALVQAMRFRDHAEDMLARFRKIAVEAVEASSYREVARITGVSTNTLQRWVREAKS